MRILVLDDNEILRGAPEEGWHDYREDLFIQTRNVKQFVERFFKECWDEVWIDHDLGPYAETGRNATYEIYCYMLGSNRKPLSKPLVRIISMNSYTASNMYSDMVRCGLTVKTVPIYMLSYAGISRGDVIHY